MLVVKAKGLIEVNDWINKVSKDFPMAIDKNTWNIAQMTQSELRRAREQANIGDFTGRLSSALNDKPKRLQRNVFSISMPFYAGMLEDMPVHKAGPLSNPRGAVLAAWMEAKGIRDVYGFVPFAITVKPHPFIGSAMARVAQRLEGELRNGPIIRTLRGGR